MEGVWILPLSEFTMRLQDTIVEISPPHAAGIEREVRILVVKRIRLSAFYVRTNVKKLMVYSSWWYSSLRKSSTGDLYYLDTLELCGQEDPSQAGFSIYEKSQSYLQFPSTLISILNSFRHVIVLTWIHQIRTGRKFLLKFATNDTICLDILKTFISRSGFLLLSGCFMHKRREDMKNPQNSENPNIKIPQAPSRSLKTSTPRLSGWWEKF